MTAEVPRSCDVLFQRRRNDDAVGLLFEDRSWTYREWIAEACARAAWLADLAEPGPRHVGLLLDNVPDFVFWTSACLISDWTLVGLNPTRTAAELATDIAHTDCQLVITEPAHLDLVSDARRVLVVGSDEHGAGVAARAAADWPAKAPQPDDIAFLIFTSGSTGAPKACIRAHRTVAPTAAFSHVVTGNTAKDVLYCAMPLFHTNSLFMSFLAAVAVGARLVLRRKFSASGFLPDVRRYGVTFFNYVGRPLSYILATPPEPDDADNTLRTAFGAEASDADIERFAARFGCNVIDTYGTTEGVVACLRESGMPPGALGRLPDGHQVVDPDTREPCPPAVFDAHGQLSNGNEAIGEIVRTHAEGLFEGYYKNPAANEAKVSGGWYWSGDLGYVDRDGWLYFAGRDDNWIRVDGENIAAAPIEQALSALDGVAAAAAFAVPAVDAGDEVMVTLELAPGVTLDASGLDALIASARLNRKARPRFVRLARSMPTTATAKVQRNQLRSEAWRTPDPIFWRPAREPSYQLFSASDADRVAAALDAHGRSHLLVRSAAADTTG